MLAGVVSAVNVVGGLFGSNPKDPERLAKNAQWYQEAVAGDPDARVALQYMTGDYGITHQGRYCNQGGCAGWGSSTAKQDARTKWNQLQGAARVGQVAGTVGQIVDRIGQAAHQVTSPAGATPAGPISTAVPGTATAAQVNTGWLVVGAVLLLLLVRR